MAVLLGGPALAVDDGLDAIAGRALFRRNWVPAPASVDGADGLGPLYNARSCVACHPAAGAAPIKAQPDGSVVIGGAAVRVAAPGGAIHPWYGRQLQTEAVPGLKPEARVRLTAPAPGAPSQLDIELLGPPIGDDFRTGIRIAPSLHGRGELDDIDEAAVQALAKQGKGRARMIAAPDGKPTLGRFGWKASQPTLTEQIAEAFMLDLGLSSPRRPNPYGDCTPLQVECRALPHGESRNFDGREVSGPMLELVATYLRSHPGPEPAADPDASATFEAIGCAACHVPRMPRRGGGDVRAFTDLLLHDMGEALDDGVTEPGAASREWRTAPLIDLKPEGHEKRYMHDGRAADLVGAVRAHGGEATYARDGFEALPADDRTRLIRYLERL